MRSKTFDIGGHAALNSSPLHPNVGGWEFLAFLFLLAVTLSVYSPLRSHEFVNYDDPDYVVRNSHINGGLSWGSVRWALTATEQANWHPLTWMSHAVDCQLFGLNPAGHHMVNLSLHALNAALLACLLMLATRAPQRSLAVAALFALHPLNVETVAWVAERKNLLSTFFFLITLIAYCGYARKPGSWRYLLVFVAFVLALASKPMVVTLPFVLLLMDYWPLRRIQGRSLADKTNPFSQITPTGCVLEKMPLLALSAASSTITVAAQGGAVQALVTFSLTERLENAVYSYVLYLWKMIYPLHLAVFYPHPGNTLSVAKVIFSIVFLLAVSSVAWLARARFPYLLFGWFWFVGTLIPVIGVVQVGAQAMADRYAYITVIGIFVAVVWGLGDLCKAFQIETPWLAVAAIAALLALSWITWREIGYWHDSISLWSHALEVTPDNPFSEDQLGMALLAQNRQEEAMKHFETAIRLGTRDATGFLNVGAYLSEHGRQPEAIPLLETALDKAGNTETRVLTHLNLGFAYTSTGDYQNARLQYGEAWNLDQAQVTEAIRQLAGFVPLHPSARDYMKLGLLEEQAGKRAEAESAFEHVLQIDPQADAAREALSELH